jgi:hypothetical protein
MEGRAIFWWFTSLMHRFPETGAFGPAPAACGAGVPRRIGGGVDRAGGELRRTAAERLTCLKTRLPRPGGHGHAAQLPWDFATFLVQCLNAVQYGLLLFPAGVGLTLIFGIMGVINLAHGSFYMMGPTWPSCWRRTSPTSSADAARGVVLSAIFGYVLEWAFFSYLYQREHLQQVLMTWR